METGIGKMDAGGEKMGHRNVENGAPVRGPQIRVPLCLVPGRPPREPRGGRCSNILIDIYIYIIYERTNLSVTFIAEPLGQHYSAGDPVIIECNI